MKEKQVRPRTIMCYDLAYHKTGWCLYDVVDEKLITYGTFNAGHPSNLLGEIAKTMMIDEAFDMIVVESLPKQFKRIFNPKTKRMMNVTNIGTLQTLAKAHGILETFSKPDGSDYFNIHVMQVRNFLAVKGKEQVMQYVNKRFKTNIKDEDITDAIGLAVTFKHGWNQSINNDIAELTTKIKTLKQQRSIDKYQGEIDRLEALKYN